MQAGSLASNDVMALTSRILVDGVERPHVSWSVDRDLVGELPAQVVAGGGIRQATGAIVWAEQEDVTDGSVNPWNPSTGWVPVSGQAIVIYCGDGTTAWRQFVGYIDEVSGGIGEGFQSSIVGRDDLLNRTVEHSTVFSVHPPTVEGGSYCSVGMGAGYVVDRVMRASGFPATPQRRPRSLVSVPAQLSMWPEWGAVRSSDTPAKVQDGDGWWVAACSSSYAPNLLYGPVTRSTAVELTIMVSPAHSGTTTLDAIYGTDYIRLRVNPSRGATALLNGTTVATLPSMGADKVVSLLVKGGTWTIRTANATASGTMTVPAGAALSTVRITGDTNARASGFQVSQPLPAEEFGSLNSGGLFKQQHQTFSHSMAALRSYQLKPGIEVLDEISKAILAPVWIDETGAAKMYSSDFLRNQPSMQTITTLDDITKLSWSMNHLDTRSKVVVKYQLPAISMSRYSNILLWQGGGETMESGETKSLFVTEPADEDWTEHNEWSASFADFNAGRGTVSQGYVEKADGTWEATGPGSLFSPGQPIGMETILFEIEAGTLAAGSKLVLATPADTANYSPRMEGVNLPILRGRGKAMWTEASVTSEIRGPSNAPELIHDAGPWISHVGYTVLQLRMADYIAEQVTAPHATIPGLEVIYDPRRQLGDVITISSPTYMGVELTALIVGVRNAAGDSFTQSLDVRIISASSTFTTYAEHEAAYPDSLTYEQWRTIYPDTTTYTGFNTDPLEGAS